VIRKKIYRDEPKPWCLTHRLAKRRTEIESSRKVGMQNIVVKTEDAMAKALVACLQKNAKHAA
jgi:hypothetical protein